MIQFGIFAPFKIYLLKLCVNKRVLVFVKLTTLLNHTFTAPFDLIISPFDLSVTMKDVKDHYDILLTYFYPHSLIFPALSLSAIPFVNLVNDSFQIILQGFYFLILSMTLTDHVSLDCGYSCLRLHHLHHDHLHFHFFDASFSLFFFLYLCHGLYPYFYPYPYVSSSSSLSPSSLSSALLPPLQPFFSRLRNPCPNPVTNRAGQV